MPVIKVTDLPLSNIAREFVGADHGGDPRQPAFRHHVA
jgi:hypothetical protein